MSRYIIEYEVLHRQGQIAWSEMKAYPTIFTDQNIDEAKRIVNILSQIHNDCNIVELEVSCEKTEDDVYHHMFDAFKDNQGDCDRCIYNNRKSDSDENSKKTEDVVFHHMFYDYPENQGDCDRCVKNTNGIEWDNSTNRLQHLIDISVAPRCICAHLKDPLGGFWSVLWLHEPKDVDAMKTYYYYNESGEEIPTDGIDKFINLD